MRDLTARVGGLEGDVGDTVATRSGDGPMTSGCGRPRRLCPFGGRPNGAKEIDKRALRAWNSGSVPFVPRKGPLTGA
ncbi:hypothetical protein GCM10009559_23810 [Pseudonocardia zijingensis]|uniref:Uncharacterized protein n=1 Tax=Pseudonocardia zijingensis TaxID=153376 RepID=A0ABN1PX87_9PSEU